jgi:methionyl-tRNA formyltransferase
MGDFNKILLFGTNIGIKQIITKIPANKIAGIVAPGIRALEVNYVRELAKTCSSPFFVQPKFNSADYSRFLENLNELDFDSIISNCYSMIIRPDVLHMCEYNAVNIHWSYLPYNRGPNPVQWTLIKGEKYTGVTLHFISDSIDSGDIVNQIKVKIEENDSWVTLEKKLFKASNKLLDLSLPKLFSGHFNCFRQDNNITNHNSRLNEDSPLIDFKKMSNYQIFNLIRAQVEPLKGAYIIYNSDKIYFSKILSINEIEQLRLRYES